MIDLTSLRNALKSLDKAAKRSLEAPSDEEVGDAVIQRFEYCYELSWKMLFADLSKIRKNGSNIVSKEILPLTIYDEKKAKSVYKTAIHYLPDAQKLLAQLDASLESD